MRSSTIILKDLQCMWSFEANVLVYECVLYFRCSCLKHFTMKKMQPHYNVLGVWMPSNPKKLCLRVFNSSNIVHISNCGQQNPQWSLCGPMVIVFAFDQCLDLRNATHDQHPEGVIFSRCSLMPCPKVFHLVRWLEVVMSLWERFSEVLPFDQTSILLFILESEVISFHSKFHFLAKLRAWGKRGVVRGVKSLQLHKSSCGDLFESANHLLLLI